MYLWPQFNSLTAFNVLYTFNRAVQFNSCVLLILQSRGALYWRLGHAFRGSIGVIYSCIRNDAEYIRHIGKWNNLFTATLKVTNTCQENLAITDVFGEYMNEG